MINIAEYWLRYGVLPIGGGEGEDDKGDKGDKQGDTVTKADHEKVLADFNKAKDDLEDMRMEVLTPEYLDYLNTKDKPKEDKDKTKDKEKEGDITDDQLKGMSPKEILALATKRAEDSFKANLDTFKSDVKSKSDAATKAEVAAFAGKHDDYSTFRPIMYGLSLDPKNAGLSLQELYDLSKEHVKGIHAETTDAEKVKQQEAEGEKPGGASEGFDKEGKKLSPEAATAEAAKEVSDKLGAIPPA